MSGRATCSVQVAPSQNRSPSTPGLGRRTIPQVGPSLRTFGSTDCVAAPLNLAGRCPSPPGRWDTVPGNKPYFCRRCENRIVGRASQVLAASVLAMCALVGSGTTASAASTDSALKQAALTYASVTLSGPFAGVEAVLSPECRSGDHLSISGLLPTARSIWGNQMGISLARIRTTGVRVPRPCWQKCSSRSGVQHIKGRKQTTGSHMTLIRGTGSWAVSVRCPFGNSQSSSSIVGTGGRPASEAL